MARVGLLATYPADINDQDRFYHQKILVIHEVPLIFHDFCRDLTRCQHVEVEIPK